MEEIEITTTSQAVSDIGLMSIEERELYTTTLVADLGLPEMTASMIASTGIQEHADRLLVARHEIPELAVRQLVELARGGLSVAIAPFIQSGEQPSETTTLTIQPTIPTRAISADDNPVTTIIPAGSPTKITGLLVEAAVENIREQATADQRIAVGNYNPNELGGRTRLFVHDARLPAGKHGLDAESLARVRQSLLGRYFAGRRGGAATWPSYALLASPTYKLISGTPPPPPLIPRDILDIPEDIYEVLSSAFAGAIGLTSQRAFEADLFTGGISELYWAATTLGISAEETQKQLRDKHQRVRDIKFKQEVAILRVRDAARISSVKLIVEQKFGPATLRTLEQKTRLKPMSMTRPQELIDLLEPTQAKYVLAEMARRDKKAKAVAGNKCEHVRLLAQFRRADGRRRQELWSSLTGFIPAGVRDKPLACNVCHFDMLCPHELEIIQAEQRNDGFSEIRKRLQPYLDTSTRASIGYFCSVCGEVLAPRMELDDDMISAGVMDEDLKNTLWSEAGHALSSIATNTVFNPRTFIEALVSVCYPRVREMESQLMKSRTLNPMELENRRRLYISFYVYAFLVHFIKSNPSVHFRGMQAKSGAPEMIKYSVGLILGAKNIILRTMPDVTAESIANNLVGAYKQLQSASGPVKFTQELEPVVDILPRDPIFAYISNYAKTEELASGKLTVAQAQKYVPVEHLESLLGASSAKLEKQQNIFEHVRSASAPAGRPAPKLDASPRGTPGSLTALGLWSHREAYSKLVQYLRAGGFAKHGQQTISSQDGGQNWLSAAAQFTPAIKSFIDSLEPIREVDAKLVLARKWTVAKNTGRHAVQQHSPALVGTSASRLYDAEGRPHNFNLFITEAGELTRADIAKMLSRGEPSPAQVTDAKCSVCGVLRSVAESTDSKTVQAGLAELATIGNFYIFYEISCPAGEFHSRDNVAAACAKCGITAKMTSAPGSKVAREIHKKYESAWAKALEDLKPPPVNLNVDMSDVYAAEDTDRAQQEKYFEDWVYSTSIASDLAEHVGVDVAYLLALGGIEEYKYADIPTELANMNPPESNLDSRAYKIHAHILGLLVLQGTLREYYSTPKPSELVVKIIDSSGLAGDSLREEIAAIPPPSGDFCAAFNYIKLAGSPQTILEFALFSLWKMLLELWNVSKLRQAIVAGYVKHILDIERALSVPGYFNWGLVFGDKHLTELGEDTIVAQVEDNETDDIEEAVEKNLFSTAAFDMEDEEGSEEGGVNFRSEAADAAGM